MGPKKFVFKIYGVNSQTEQVFLTEEQIRFLNPKNFKELTFSIEEEVSRRRVAFLRFAFVDGSTRLFHPDLFNSKENPSLAASFFRTFRQSPFRLVLFSSLTFLEKNGFHKFISGAGLDDLGASHAKQVRQRIFTHEKRKNGYNQLVHKLGEFPRVSFSELDKILAANKPVPERLLPPESILRKVRAKSYAHLKLLKMGKEKYKKMRKLKMGRK